MAIIMDGKKVANEFYEKLAERINKLDSRPSLTVVIVGDDEASNIYVNNKIKACEKLGITSNVIKLSENITHNKLENVIKDLNNDITCDAILVQAPLPEHIDANEIFNLIDKNKDVDGFNISNAGALTKSNEGFIPCTVKGIAYLLDFYNISVSGKDVTVIGRSNIVGKPLANYLINRDATVTVCHSKTKDLREKTINADIVISATGKSNLIDESYIKENAVVIDVGINRDNGALKGDVLFNKVKDKASYITPVPGGVGPMTVAMLMENVVIAKERKDANG